MACPSNTQVEKKHGRVGAKINAKDFRAACRKYAQEQVELQRSEFKRFGVLGDWNRPYLTMDPRFEGQQIRALGHIIRNGHLYKGAKPVHWCLDCRSALAEAEVEYEDKTSSGRRRGIPRRRSTAIWRGVSGSNPDVLGAFPVSIPIWTTTPWTLPANEAVSLGPEDRIRAALGVAQRHVRVVGAGQRAARCLPGALWPRQGPGAGAVRGRRARASAARSIRSCRNTCRSSSVTT